jgi:hypothetical protein
MWLGSTTQNSRSLYVPISPSSIYTNVRIRQHNKTPPSLHWPQSALSQIIHTMWLGSITKHSGSLYRPPSVLTQGWFRASVSQNVSYRRLSRGQCLSNFSTLVPTSTVTRFWGSLGSIRHISSTSKCSMFNIIQFCREIRVQISGSVICTNVTILQHGRYRGEVSSNRFQPIWRLKYAKITESYVQW